MRLLSGVASDDVDDQKYKERVDDLYQKYMERESAKSDWTFYRFAVDEYSNKIELAKLKARC